MSKYNVKIDGIIETDELYLVGFERFFNISEASDVMSNDFMKLGSFIKDGITVEEGFMSIYKSYNCKTKDVVTFNAVSVKPSEKCLEILENYGSWGIIPFYPAVLKVTLNGAYQHLGEAWETAYNFIKENDLIVDTTASGWEKYKIGFFEAQNEEEFVTEIFIPLIPLEEDDEV